MLKTVAPLALVGYEMILMIIANSMLPSLFNREGKNTTATPIGQRRLKNELIFYLRILRYP